MLGQKGAYQRSFTRDDELRRELRKACHAELLVPVTQGDRVVEHVCALVGGDLQQIGAVKEFVIKWWVFAHDDGVETLRRSFVCFADLVPAVAFDEAEVVNHQPCLVLTQEKPALFRNKQAVAAFGGGPHNGEAAVFIGGEARERVEDEGKAHGGQDSFSGSFSSSSMAAASNARRATTP